MTRNGIIEGKVYSWDDVVKALPNTTILVTDRKFENSILIFKVIKIYEPEEYDYTIVYLMRHQIPDLVSYYVTPDSYPDENMCIRYGTKELDGKEYPIYSWQDLEYNYPNKWVVYLRDKNIDDSRLYLCTLLGVVDTRDEKVKLQFSFDRSLCAVGSYTTPSNFMGVIF